MFCSSRIFEATSLFDLKNVSAYFTNNIYEASTEYRGKNLLLNNSYIKTILSM